MIRNASTSLWTAARTRRLVKLTRDGLSAAKAAEKLGRPFTRNAVIGKRDRLRKAGVDLTRRPRP